MQKTLYFFLATVNTELTAQLRNLWPQLVTKLFLELIFVVCLDYAVNGTN